MKALLLGLAAALLYCVPAQAQSASYHRTAQDNLADAAVTVITPTKDTWVAAIPDAYASQFPYGWWDAWHLLKDNQQYERAPFTFRHLPPGGYTLVVYDPASARLVNVPPDASDGVIIEKLTLRAGHQHFFVFNDQDFIDWNCLSCPWLYLYDGKDYVRAEEILKDVVGEANKTTTRHPMTAEAIVDGRVRVRIQEEKDEITYLDGLTLVVGGRRLPALAEGTAKAELLAHDGAYVVLRKGEAIDLEFALPEGVASTDALHLEAHGYYAPDVSMLEAVVGHRFLAEPAGR